MNFFKYELPPLSPINVLTHRTKTHIEVANTCEGHFFIQLESSYEKKPNITKIRISTGKERNQFFYLQGQDMFYYEVNGDNLSGISNIVDLENDCVSTNILLLTITLAFNLKNHFLNLFLSLHQLLYMGIAKQICTFTNCTKCS